jgi:hypothetical protein
MTERVRNSLDHLDPMLAIALFMARPGQAR